MNDDVNYEIWVQTVDGKWGQAVDKESGAKRWPTRNMAMETADVLAQDIRVVAVVGIKRSLSFTVKGKGVLGGNGRNENPEAGAVQDPEVRDRPSDEGRSEGEPRG